MKKLLMVVAVLATAGLAMAAPAFTLPAEIDLQVGVPVDVYVGAINLADVGGIQGMNLYLGATGPVVLTNMQILDITGGIFTGGTTGNANNPSLLDAIDPQTWESSLSVKSGTISTPGNVAKITITATALGTGTLSTDITNTYGVASDFAGVEAGQATAVIKVLPEPTSLLLLIAGLPLLRRRHA